MALGKISGELHRGEWDDIGTPSRLSELDTRLRLEQGSNGRG